MGVVFRQSIKTTIVTFIGAVLGGVLILVSSNVMPEQQLGLVRNFPIQAVLASYFLTVGMGNTLFLFLHRFDNNDNPERKSVLISLCFMVPLIIFCLAMIPYFLFQDQLFRFFQEKDVSLLKQYMLCFPLFTLFSIIIIVLEGFLTAHIRTAQVSFVREIFMKGGNLLLFILFGFSLISFNVFIYAYVSVNLISVLILFFMAGRIEDFKFSFKWHLLARKEYREIFLFSAFHGLMNISATLIGFLDTQLLAGLSPEGLSAIPVYTNATYLATLVSIPYRAMSAPASGDISRAYAKGDHEKVADSYKRSGLNILIASVFMCVIIVCNLHNAKAVLPVGHEAVSVLTLIMIIGRLTDSGTGLTDIALNISPYYRSNFYLSACLVTFMVICFYLVIPSYGLLGAAFVYTLSLGLFNLIKAYLVWTKLRLSPFSKGSLIALLIGLAVGVPIFFLPHSANPFLDAFWRSGLILAAFAGLVIWLKPSPDISHYINETLKKKKLF
jgi:O-antigen/teichoic acid export membrane protein